MRGSLRPSGWDIGKSYLRKFSSWLAHRFTSLSKVLPDRLSNAIREGGKAWYRKKLIKAELLIIFLFDFLRLACCLFTPFEFSLARKHLISMTNGKYMSTAQKMRQNHESKCVAADLYSVRNKFYNVSIQHGNNSSSTRQQHHYFGTRMLANRARSVK